MFSYGDVNSVAVLMDSLQDFKNVFGLAPSLAKSTIFFANVSLEVKQSIMNIMPFDEGHLPVKYLGVPLISTRLLHQDCIILVERVKNQLGDWRNKALSFAGRLQLIISVLLSMHVYWSSVFILPESITHDIEKFLHGFLWCNGDLKRGKAKVAWHNLFLPREEEGLGIQSLSTWNISLMTYHAWSIITHKESLWVRWIHEYRLKGKSFWEVCITADASCGWRKLLRNRNTICPFIISKIGDGKSTFAWHDKWSDIGHLSSVISSRNISNVGFTMQSKVSDIIENNHWKWPTDWIDKFVPLNSLPIPSLSQGARDKIYWRDKGIDYDFASSIVWNSIRDAAERVDWYAIVWFSHQFLVMLSLCG